MTKPLDRGRRRTRGICLASLASDSLLVACTLLLIHAAAPQLTGDEGENANESNRQAGLLVNTVVARTEVAVTESRAFAGIVKARRSSELSFDRAGRIVGVMVEEGDRVESGQELAELDMRRLQTRKDSLADALTRARSALDALEPSAPVATNSDQQARLQQLRVELDRLQQQLTAQAAQTPGGPSFADRLSEVERQLTLVNESSRRQQIDAQSKRIAELEAQLADVELQLDDAQLVAPFAGMVALRHVNEGTVVAAGMPVVRLVEDTALSVWVGLPLNIAADVGLGQQIQVRIGKQVVAGSVRAKLPQIERSSRTRTVLLDLPADVHGSVLPGEVARAEIRTAGALEGIWLPLSALTRDVRGLWSVLVVESAAGNSIVARRVIELLHVEGERALVRGALDDGDRVIADGTFRVVPGQRVRSNDVSTRFSPVELSRDQS